MKIKTEQLEVGYQDQIIVKGVNISVPANQITALIGPNGCGKSTLLKSVARLLDPVRGAILLDNTDISQIKAKQFARTLSLLPQTQTPPEGLTVREVISYGRSPYTGFWGQLAQSDWDRVEEAMRVTGVEELAGKKITALSGGQCQRVWLALTLAQDGDIILLDEPTTYLDLNHQVELMKLLHRLKQEGKTIITVLHDINQACRYCDHLIVMKAGKVVTTGQPGEVMTKEMLKTVFSLDAEIYPDPVAQTPMCVVC